jgi:cytochrome c oxidase assembly protein subunit 15
MWLQLALIALAVATIPLCIILFSSDSDKHRKLLAVTLALTFELIMFGAFTRLTDSGLGCPDWPGCYGESNPFQAHSDIKAAEAVMPHGPVTVAKAWIEMIHRYLAMSVGLLCIAQVVMAWRARRRGYPLSLAIACLLMVCVQGAFGAWTVTLKLQPVIVTTHLLLGMGLLALLAASLEQYQCFAGSSRISTQPQLQPRSLPWLAGAALLFVFFQIALGGWVSTNYAAMACQDYPLCHGELIPEMDFQHGFSLWRQLGLTVGGDYITYQALVAIHWVHRNFALLVVLVVGWAAWRAMQLEAYRQLGKAILFAVLAQVVLGISTVLLSWPLLLAVLHNGMAAALVLLLTMLNYRILHARRAAVY